MSCIFPFCTNNSASGYNKLNTPISSFPINHGLIIFSKFPIYNNQYFSFPSSLLNSPPPLPNLQSWENTLPPGTTTSLSKSLIYYDRGML